MPYDGHMITAEFDALLREPPSECDTSSLLDTQLSVPVRLIESPVCGLRIANLHLNVPGNSRKNR